MLKFLNFISNNMNMVIGLFGTPLIILIIGIGFKLSSHKSNIRNALDRKNTKTSINKKTLEIREQEEREPVTPETIREYEKAFNKTCSIHNMCTQLIPIFPLMGILGTVAGLMIQVDAQNMNMLIDSLNLALGSTLWGLFFAIILKLIVVVFPARIIYDVEIMLDDYDKKFNNALALKKISEE